MIARHFGKHYLPDTLMPADGITKEGMSLLALSKVAECIGFRTMAVEISLEAIEAEDLLPFIAHWSGRHFIVVYKIRGDRVWVADPARDLLVLTRAEFVEQWGQRGRGIALLLEPRPQG